MINRGSEWRKWDLHIHSPYTHSTSNKYNNTTIEEFCNEILRKEIKVIGLTNYFYITENEYNEINSHLKNNCLVIPNFEFRASDKNSKGDHINFHVLFNPKTVTIDKILLSLGNVKLHNHTNKYCRESDIKELGIDSVCVDFDLLLKQLKNDFTIENDFIIGVPYYGYGGFKVDDKPRNITQEKKIDEFSHFIFGNNQCKSLFLSPREYTISGNHYIINKSKAVIQASDAHSFEDISNKSTWIKAQPTFEGLKQIIYEPQERVKIQKEKPESEKLDTLMIKKICFKSSENRFTPEPIYFNKNLNVIIGGKSSGKSILLYKIARTLYGEILPFNSDEDLLKNDVLKYKDTKDNKYKDLYELNLITDDKIDEKFDFEIELFSGSKQTLKERNSQSSILPSIKYIPQNHLSNLVDRSRKNGATLKKIIRDLILEIPEFRKKYDDFIDQVRRNDTQRNQDIDFYFTLKEELSKKETELASKGDVKALEEGIKFNKQKIKELNKDFTPEEQSEYKTLTEKLSSLKIKENQINSDFEKLNVYQIDLKRFLIEYFNKKKITLDSVQTESIKKEYSNKLQFVDDALSSINELEKDFNKTVDNNYIDCSFFAKELKQINDEINQINIGLKDYNENLEDQKQIIALQKSITTDESKLSEINHFAKEIITLKDSIKKHKEKIFADFEENFKLYKKVINDLFPRINEIEKGTDKIEIIPSIKYNFPKFRKLCEDTFNIRSFNNEGFDYIYQYSDKKPKSALSDIDYKKIGEALVVLFEKIENKKILPKGGNTEKESCKRILTDFFFDHWDVKSDNDDIHKMSTGKASFVLLKLIIKLSNEDAPILIDQPEDNLDNRSVSKELVEFLKEKKKERQIILVTHNPNIVVNADAENIIVANQKGQNDIESTSDFHFDYINGALEDTFAKNDLTDLLKSMGIREHIAEIVEGGKEAFKKREEKYGF